MIEIMISCVLLFAGVAKDEAAWVIASGLFAIAGDISYLKKH